MCYITPNLFNFFSNTFMLIEFYALLNLYFSRVKIGKVFDLLTTVTS